MQGRNFESSPSAVLPTLLFVRSLPIKNSLIRPAMRRRHSVCWNSIWWFSIILWLDCFIICIWIGFEYTSWRKVSWTKMIQTFFYCYFIAWGSNSKLKYSICTIHKHYVSVSKNCSVFFHFYDILFWRTEIEDIRIW